MDDLHEPDNKRVIGMYKYRDDMVAKIRIRISETVL